MYFIIGLVFIFTGWTFCLLYPPWSKYGPIHAVHTLQMGELLDMVRYVVLLGICALSNYVQSRRESGEAPSSSPGTDSNLQNSKELLGAAKYVAAPTAETEGDADVGEE